MRQVGHHMESDLDPGVPQEPVCLGSIGHRAPPAVEGKDSIVYMLDAQFYLGDAEIEHPVDVLFSAPVRARSQT